MRDLEWTYFTAGDVKASLQQLSLLKQHVAKNSAAGAEASKKTATERVTSRAKLEERAPPQFDVPGGHLRPGTAALAEALINKVYSTTGRQLRQFPEGRQLLSA
ncbi:UNVERIFIED_ORG: hypothetical protein J2Y81_007775 [Paraburkholderia sediminicola]|nr:hypothetical protein [Paraburkholderia sediminicola]